MRKEKQMFEQFSCGKFRVLYQKYSASTNIYLYPTDEQSLFPPCPGILIALEDAVSIPGQKLNKNVFELTTSAELLGPKEKSDILKFTKKDDVINVSTYMDNGKTKTLLSQDISINDWNQFLKDRYTHLLDILTSERSFINKDKDASSLKEYKDYGKKIEKVEKFLKNL